jgi:hypothetical protein
MKVMCIKEMKSTDPVFTSIKIGDWIEVNLKSIYTKTNEDPNASSYYYFINSGEYAFNKDNFITLQQWREQQLNKLI